MKHLYDRGLGQTDLIQLARLIDWMMALSPVEAGRFDTDIRAFEKEKEMPFITPREQGWLDQGVARGRAEGIATGRAEVYVEGIEALLDTRFGAEGVALMPRVRRITESGALAQFLKACKTASLEELRAALPPE